MLFREDNTYKDLCEKSFEQWLDDMEKHDDLAVRGGVNLTRRYVDSLKSEILRLKEKDALKNEYLKKLSGRK